MRQRAFFLAVLAISILPSAAAALVLCRRPSGVLAARGVCRRRETLIDPATLAPAGNAFLPCPADSVKVGDVCVDKYEASVWSIPEANTALIEKVRRGEATLEDLNGGGATQPGAIVRGGYFGFFGGSNAGIFSIYALNEPRFEVEGIGFRCGR